ncbi:Protein of unknown function [Paenibacillus sp. yr247]|uniref:DUF2642 domain-containing protein n=1 Tax=Paenibacillus sp. yr247 TaxID=1761880 RepID=UPI000889B64A|nr:DUF2642 domain-containing protein [Paenibacillus sp. yr247]SDO21724.1 Protein of unknown function [Paenibacillus sp. yr247]
MAEVVVLRASFDGHRIDVKYVSSSISRYKKELHGKSVARAMVILQGANFTLDYKQSDSKGITLIFTLGTETPNPLIELLQSRLNTRVTILTDAGEVSGILTLIGTDVIQINEDSGNIVLILISQINGVI